MMLTGGNERYARNRHDHHDRVILKVKRGRQRAAAS